MDGVEEGGVILARTRRSWHAIATGHTNTSVEMHQLRVVIRQELQMREFHQNLKTLEGAVLAVGGGSSWMGLLGLLEGLLRRRKFE